MVTIRGTFRLRPTVADMRSCVWCSQGTDVLMETPGRPELGSVPLHATCAAMIIWAYRDAQSGHKLTAEATEGMARLAAYPRLQAGRVSPS